MGIVLAVCGAGLYFLRSFKPALARDYDVFFAAIGLLCGGILFFQGWRLDPILQFGQFLLAGTTVFFAYESVRLRGLATDQARRSSYFEEDSIPSRMPRGGYEERWDDNYDQLDEPLPLRRRFVGNDEDLNQESSYRTRRTSRAAIPEQAASRSRRSRSEGSSWKEEDQEKRRMSRFSDVNNETEERRGTGSSFGERRNIRQDQRRGSRPSPNSQIPSKTRRKPETDSYASRKIDEPSSRSRQIGSKSNTSSVSNNAEDAAFYSSNKKTSSSNTKPLNNPGQKRSSVYSKNSRSTGSSSKPRRRDNSSRFDN